MKIDKLVLKTEDFLFGVNMTISLIIKIENRN